MNKQLRNAILVALGALTAGTASADRKSVV